jgi:hypothetical protein
MGEEVAQFNGAYKVTEGLLAKYGPKRIVDTPISEAGFIGMGIGASMLGVRPVMELMFWSFYSVAFDQILSNAANVRYMSGGQINCPIVIRGPANGGTNVGATHSHTPENVLANHPGVKVVVPSTAYDAKGLLKSAIRDNDPVLFLENTILYGEKCEVPDGEYLIPLGKADVKREGTDLTIVTYGRAIQIPRGRRTPQGEAQSPSKSSTCARSARSTSTPSSLRGQEPPRPHRRGAEALRQSAPARRHDPAGRPSTTSTVRSTACHDRRAGHLQSAGRNRAAAQPEPRGRRPRSKRLKFNPPVVSSQASIHPLVSSSSLRFVSYSPTRYSATPTSRSPTMAQIIEMPKLSDTMTVGTLVKWLKKEGDRRQVRRHARRGRDRQGHDGARVLLRRHAPEDLRPGRLSRSPSAPRSAPSARPASRHRLRLLLRLPRAMHPRPKLPRPSPLLRLRLRRRQPLRLWRSHRTNQP